MVTAHEASDKSSATAHEASDKCNATAHEASDKCSATAHEASDKRSATAHEASDKRIATAHEASDTGSVTASASSRRSTEVVLIQPQSLNTTCYVAAPITPIVAILAILATCSALVLSSHHLTPRNGWFVPASRRDHVIARAFRKIESRAYTGDGGDSGAADRRERVMREEGGWFEEATRRLVKERRVLLGVSSLLSVRLTWWKQRRASEQQQKQTQQAQDQARTRRKQDKQRRRALKQRARASRGASKSATTGVEFIDRLADTLPIPKEPKVTVGEIVVQALQLRIHGNPLDPQKLALYMSARMNASGSMLNPNAYTMLADTIWMNAKYKGRRVGNTKIHNVQVKGRTSAPFAVPMKVVDFPIVSSTSYSTLVAVMNQKLPIDVLITTLARIRYNGVTSPQVKAYVRCKAIVNPLTIQVISQVCGSSSIGL